MNEQDFINEQLGEPFTDARAFGKKMAAGFRWNGLLILEAAAYALEDANFHAEAAEVHSINRKIETKLEAVRNAATVQD